MDIAASARRDSVELRTDIPADVAETLDAESLAEGITRGQRASSTANAEFRRDASR